MPANPPSWKSLKALNRPEMVFCVAHVPGGRRVVFGGSDFGVYDVDFAQEKPAPRKIGDHESYVNAVALAGRSIVSGGYDGKLMWWDLDSGTPVRSIAAHSRAIRDVAASPDGSFVVSVGDDMACRIWDARTGIRRFDLAGHAEMTPHHFPSMLYACAVSPDGRFVASGDKVGHIVVWDASTGRSVTTLETPVMYTWDPTQRRHSIGGIRALAFSPDGAKLAVGGIGPIGNIDHLEGLARVEAFDWTSGKRLYEFPGESTKGIVEKLLFLPDGRRILAVGGANDGFVMILDLDAKGALMQEKAPAHVHDVAFGDSAETVFTAAHARLAEFEMKA